jgi:hypothetical protein
MYTMADREEFAAGFARSRRGNLWRRWETDQGDEITLTVFPRRGATSPTASATTRGRRTARGLTSRPTEEEAIRALWVRLGNTL